MKRLTLLALLVLIPMMIFAQSVTEQTSNASETRIYTDSLGRNVEIPVTVTKVAPSGNVAQLAIYAVAPEKMVGWSSRLSDTAMATFLPEVAELPVFGAFYGKKANLNKEALIVANPEIVIDVGEIKGSKEEMAKQLDELSANIGIPIVFVEGYLENADEMFLMLGDILNKDDQAKALAKFSRDALDMGIEKRDGINTTVYYSSAPDGLQAVETGSFHGEVIEYIGARNIVPESFTKSNGSTSLEQIYLWDPDVIILSSKDAYATATTDKAWAELRAVQNGNVIMMPIVPYPFLDTPPATNRIIGIYWLGNKLNPEMYDLDINQKVKEFYSLFYHKELTDAELESILNP